MGWKEDKQERKEHYINYVHGWKLRKCGACRGSGKYDHNGSPSCGACEGTGKERYKPIEVEFNWSNHWLGYYCEYCGSATDDEIKIGWKCRSCGNIISKIKKYSF